MVPRFCISNEFPGDLKFLVERLHLRTASLDKGHDPHPLTLLSEFSSNFWYLLLQSTSVRIRYSQSSLPLKLKKQNKNTMILATSPTSTASISHFPAIRDFCRVRTPTVIIVYISHPTGPVQRVPFCHLCKYICILCFFPPTGQISHPLAFWHHYC